MRLKERDNLLMQATRLKLVENVNNKANIFDTIKVLLLIEFSNFLYIYFVVIHILMP